MLAREIESILKSSYPANRLEIIIVDDASSDGTSDFVKEKYPQVLVIRNNEEKGLAGSRNIGIRVATAKILLLIDDDNIVDKDAIREMVTVLTTHKEVGVVGPLMLYHKNPKRIWYAWAERSNITSITRFPHRDENITDVRVPNIIETEDIPNAFMIRRDLIERIGFFDEITFPIHYDEADFAARAARAGFKTIINPNAIVWHDMPLPEEIRDKARLFHCQNEFRAFYCGRNRILFHRKYSRKWEFAIFVTIFNWAIMLYYLRVILSSSARPRSERIKIAKAYVKGVFEALF